MGVSTWWFFGHVCVEQAVTLESFRGVARTPNNKVKQKMTTQYWTKGENFVI
jgi:hypothetical protein